MPRVMLHLIFSQDMIKESVIYTMAREYDVIPNIRRAKVTEEIGEVTLELSGTEEALEKGRRYLEEKGVKVEPVVGDIIE